MICFARLVGWLVRRLVLQNARVSLLFEERVGKIHCAVTGSTQSGSGGAREEGEEEVEGGGERWREVEREGERGRNSCCR